MWSVPQPPPVASPSSFSSRSDSWIQSSVDSFLKAGRKIRVGDCALFQAGNAPPFIGIIRWFTTSKEDCLKLCVNWLYRPSDVRLSKGLLLEAAPNELFYSFHKDVISAASLLHPCKVAFLRKGVELPPGISSFVCRRVYDIANKCLWWLTDQDYINERQEEVDQLLDKTQLEMHAAVQSGGRSPKPLNGPTSTQQLKSGTDSVQNSAKSKKRERGGDHGIDPIKRERPAKLEDSECVSSRLDNMIKAEIPKITEKGALVTTEDAEKLVHLVQLDKKERKIDLANKILLADVIAATDRIVCLSRFVQLRGVPVLDDWLQEAHKGKESDKGSEDLLLALLRALDKLPVNLNALQTCNVGKSVNHLRSHKNIEIQKKARSLVDTWKKRVDAEMTLTKTPISQTSSACKTIVGKPGHADAIVKSTPVTPGSLKLPSCLPAKGGASSGNSELPLTTVKEEKSSGSSQSHNNSQSCSGDHAKTVGSSWKEDARNSTAVSANANKTSGGSSRHRRLGNGFSGCSPSGAQKEKSGKVSNHSGLSSERAVDMPSTDHGNSHRLIVRLPNHFCSSSGNGKGVSVIESKTRNSHSSMNALIESCAKYSETSTSISAGDDIGINLLANVAAGEISNVDSVSPSGTPGSSPTEEPCATNNEAKSRLSCEDGVAQNHGQSDENADFDSRMLLANDKLQEISMHSSAESKITSSIQEKKLTTNQSEVEDNMPVGYTCEMIKEGSRRASDLAEESSLHASSVNEVSGGASVADQQQLHAAENHVENADKIDNHNNIPSSTANKIPSSRIADECKAQKSDELIDNSLDAPSNDEQVDEILERKEAFDEKSAASKLSGASPDRKEEVASSVETSSAKLDFDLNEGFSGDDANQKEPVCSLAFRLPVISNGTRHPITVASPAKGPFVPPENLLKSKGEEPGWKGSASTSAFRKVLEPPPSTSPLDIDLNVADESCSPQTTGPESGSVTRSIGGLDLDLNKTDECADYEPSRDFDLNSGPGQDEIGPESLPRSQQIKRGNISSWFAPSNSYPIVGAPGQRILGPGNFGSDIYRGPVLSATPAMTFPPPTAFPYASFPFGSAPLVDSPCFPGIPSQFVGPAGSAVPSHYPRPYMMSLPEGSNGTGSERGRRWVGQGLDLNAGPGSADVDHVSGGGMKRKDREGGSWDERFCKQSSRQ